jgi:hypothetical protein
MAMRSFPLAAIALLLVLVAPVCSHAQKLHAKPSTHDFGNVQLGNPTSFSFLLVNTGTKALRITSASMSGGAFSLGPLHLPAKLRPGAGMTLPVIFSPAAVGQAQGVATVYSNDPRSPLAIKVSGTGIPVKGVQLTVTPATLDLGNVVVGSSGSLPITLRARGGSVTITSDQTNSSEFAIMGLNLPVKIPQGQSIQATIQFTPNASGVATAKAGFFSNAQDSPAFEDLTGTGVAQSQHQVDLTWDPGDGNAVGYNVYRGSTQGGPYEQINSTLVASTNYSDMSVQGGTTYYYVATEVNSQGQQSGYSNETKAQIPN